MSLRLTLKIFLKDVQRLWWMILLTAVLLGRLVHFDSWREAPVPNNEEGWLNILLPLAWAVLIALAVFEDPAVGESPFWFTLPCRWKPFLAAKTIFIVVFLHLPYLIGCALVLQARGLGAFSGVSLLLSHQLALAAFTVPALALATIVRNVTQYMIVAIILATAVGTLPTAGWLITDDGVTRQIRDPLILSIAALVAMWITFAQYRHRRTTSSRAVAIATVLAALVVWWLPREDFDGMQAMVSTVPASLAHEAIELVNGPGAVRQGFDLPGRVSSVRVSIPISIGELPPGYSGYFRQSSLQIEEAGGRTESAETRNRVFMHGTLEAFGSLAGGPVIADLHSDFAGMAPQWQLLMIDAATMRRIGSTPVTIEASTLATYFRNLDPTWMSLNQTAAIPGLGTCSTKVTGEYPRDELRVNCETPDPLSPVHVTILDPEGHREWKRDLSASGIRLDYPSGTWLSPVNRGDIYLSLIDEDDYREAASQWQMPREMLPNARIGIAPTVPEGHAMIRYEFRNIRLNDYVVKR